MGKIVNGVANDYEFPNLYDPNISYSKAYTEQLLAEKDKEIERLKEVIQKNDKEIDNLCKNQKKEIERLNNIIQSINSVCSSMQFSAPENMYIHLQRMIEVLDYWKKEKKND